MPYVPKYFGVREIFPDEVIQAFQGSDRIWMLMDDLILITADRLRERYGEAYVNFGNNRNRGFRDSRTTVGAKWSQHKFGRALDMNFAKVTIDEVHRDIKLWGRSKLHPFEHIHRVENITGWLHFDRANIRAIREYPHVDNRILFFNP
jgi:hypothetical protein